MANPFADNSPIDLSSIYSQSLAPAVSQPIGANSGGGAAATTPGTPIDAASLPQSPLKTNPGATQGDVGAYLQQIVQDLLAGKYTPEQLVSGGRGQNPNGRSSISDASPEANLPNMAYVGTVLSSILTPEQRAAIQYVTPELHNWLQQQVAAGHGDSIGLTRQNLQNSYNAGTANNPYGAAPNAFAGNPADLAAATQVARQADYAQYVARLHASGITNIPSQADYERGMGLQPLRPDGTQPIGTPTADALGHATSMQPVTQPTPTYTQTGIPGQPQATGVLPTASGGGYTIPPVTATNAGSGAVDPATIARLQGYIANLQGVKNPSGVQQAELQAYQTRLGDYQSRGTGTSAPTVTQPSTQKATV